MKYWFIRSPFKTRRWEDVLMSGVFNLYGIRNYASKNNIAKMQKGDRALWYSSTAGKKIYGTMFVKNKAFIDKTSDKNWLAIEFIPEVTLTKPVDWEKIKQNKKLFASSILKQKRISVVEITKEEFGEILKTASGTILATAEKKR